MEDLYQAAYHKNEYGIEGYQVAKTCNYFHHDHKFPKSKRKDPMSDARKHAKEPDPTTYNDSYESSHKRYWKKPNGKFFKAKKLTIIDDIKKKARNTPGPGEYHMDSSRSPKEKRNKGKIMSTFG